MRISQSLKKYEILRGYRAFDDVLSDSLKTEKKYITAYYKFTDLSESFPVVVGFLVSKKKSGKHF